MTGGETAGCYVAIFSIPPGAYDVYMFVISTNNVPLSMALTIPVSLK